MAYDGQDSVAVYTKVDDAELAAFLKQYDIGKLAGKTPIAQGVENTNYLLGTDRNTFILTLFEKRTPAEDLPFFMDFMSHLSASGISTPDVMKMADGGSVSTLAGRPAAVLEFLEGTPVMKPGSAECASFGKAVAHLHRAASGFLQTRQNPLSLDGWRSLARACAPRAGECAGGLGEFIEDELSYVTANWPADLPQGVVHTDLFPDNIFFSGREVSGFIDFYFSCTDFFAYDLAIAVNAWCFSSETGFMKDNAAALMDAYRRSYMLSPGEIAAFPVLLRGAALRILLTRLYDWLNRDPAAIVSVKDPLEFRDIVSFHRERYDPRLYGL